MVSCQNDSVSNEFMDKSTCIPDCFILGIRNLSASIKSLNFDLRGCIHIRAIFRTMSNIYAGIFCQTVNCFCKKSSIADVRLGFKDVFVIALLYN